jgi:hypothetical protein
MDRSVRAPAWPGRAARPAHPADRLAPTDLAARLLALLERGPALVGAGAARLREVIDLNDPTTPALAVVTLGWLEAAQQVLTAGSTAQDLQVLLSVAGRHG